MTPGEKQQGKTLAVVEAGQEGRMGTARLFNGSSRYGVRMSKDQGELQPILGGQADLFKKPTSYNKSECIEFETYR